MDTHSDNFEGTPREAAVLAQTAAVALVQRALVASTKRASRREQLVVIGTSSTTVICRNTGPVTHEFCGGGRIP